MLKNYYIIDKFICIGLILSASITTIEKTISTITIIKTIVIDRLNRQEFLTNNLFIYIQKDIINLFSKQSIMDKTGFLKHILSKVSK